MGGSKGGNTSVFLVTFYQSASLIKIFSDPFSDPICLNHKTPVNHPKNWKSAKNPKNLIPENDSLKMAFNTIQSIMFSIECVKIELSLYVTETDNLTKFSKFILTHYQTTNFKLFQTERVCRQQFQI